MQHYIKCVYYWLLPSITITTITKSIVDHQQHTHTLYQVVYTVRRTVHQYDVLYWYTHTSTGTAKCCCLLRYDTMLRAATASSRHSTVYLVYHCTGTVLVPTPSAAAAFVVGRRPSSSQHSAVVLCAVYSVLWCTVV